MRNNQKNRIEIYTKEWLNEMEKEYSFEIIHNKIRQKKILEILRDAIEQQEKIS